MTSDQQRLARIGIIVVLGLSLSACQRSESTSGTPGAVNASGQAGATMKVRRDNPCSVLLPQEVEQIVGLPIAMREVVDEETCSFPFETPAKSSGQKLKSAPSGNSTRSQKQGAETMAKTTASAMVGEKPQLIIKLYWDNGRQAIMATRAAGNLLGGVESGFEKLPGIGDEAWLGPMASSLTFVKGTTGVEIDLRMVPDGRERGIRLAKLIVSRL